MRQAIPRHSAGVSGIRTSSSEGTESVFRLYLTQVAVKVIQWDQADALPDVSHLRHLRRPMGGGQGVQGCPVCGSKRYIRPIRGSYPQPAAGALCGP